MVSLPLLILGITFVVEAISWIGKDALADFIYTFTLFFSSSPHSKKQKGLKTDIMKLRAELTATSSQDEFAKWAKLRRQLDKGIAELEAINGQATESRAAFNSLFKKLIWLLTTILPFAVTSWYSKQPVFYLPAEWFGPATWWLGLPSAPQGAIACGIWAMVCKRTINVAKDIVVDNLMKSPAAPQAATVLNAVPAQDADTSEGFSEKESKSKSEPSRKSPATGSKGGGESFNAAGKEKSAKQEL